MKPFTVLDALNAVQGTFYGDSEALKREIAFVTSDSRTADAGALFVAIPGSRVDGHSFMAECLRKGAVCCLSQRVPEAQEQPCIVVDNTLRAIGALAAWHRSRFDIPVVGVTGSVGKTTTKEMIAAVLSAQFCTHKTEKNFNNELGVPWTLLKLDEAHEASVVEMGISDFGEMRRLTHMVRPNIAVMTVIGDAHLEFLGNRGGVLRAKGEIFEGMQKNDLAILNGDDALLWTYDPGVPRLTYGLDPKNDFWAEQIEAQAENYTRCQIHHGESAFDAEIPAFGIPAVYAALAATAVGVALHMSDERIAEGLSAFQTVGDRARRIQGKRCAIISDCYNANPNSMQAALRSLSLLPRRRVAILGDMLELGKQSAQMHRAVGAQAQTEQIDLVIACGALAQEIYEGARKNGANALWYADKSSLIAQLPKLIQEGDHVLVKASHSMAFEEIVHILETL
ncbi:MAG: UDP-N-acetylmuramoyl-tripeptide--D-alanyl-D-alanine ligase [Clostridia bacterium]|nr:UDP-N-acetylmuramoyl-tripeptide--D-alanyl-D-alanine ligase [Clostridia bacterium]